jgi:hypothetical protein
MPERPERLFWLHSKEMPGAIAQNVAGVIAEFVREWDEKHSQKALFTTCVKSDETAKRLWLLRLRSQPTDERIYECFKLDCPDCDDTGWKGFCAWAQGGYKVNYSSGFPIAVV